MVLWGKSEHELQSSATATNDKLGISGLWLQCDCKEEKRISDCQVLPTISIVSNLRKTFKNNTMIVPAISMHKGYYKKFKSRILNEQTKNQHAPQLYSRSDCFK